MNECDLKGHGNEADLLEFLRKFIPHDSLIRRVGESAFKCLKENSASRGVAMVSRRVAIRIFKI